MPAAQITALPPAPLVTAPTTFATTQDTMFTGLVNYVANANTLSTEVNAEFVAVNSNLAICVAAAPICTAYALNALGFTATQGTSVTSLTVATGSKTLTTQTGKGFVVGMPVRIADSSTGLNNMDGDITAYNSGTGSLTVNVTAIEGRGTIATWNVMLVGKTNNTNLQSFRNLLIGGDFATNPWQRGTSFTNPSTNYHADRWGNFMQGSPTTSVTKQTPATGITSLRVQRTVASIIVQPLWLFQTVEMANCQDIAGQYLTLTVGMIAGANFSGGTVAISIIAGQGTVDSADILGSGFGTISMAVVAGRSPTPTGTPTKFTISGLVPANMNQIAVRLIWTPTGTAGAADYVDFYDIQLERGAIATLFERRPVEVELQLCQRYYYNNKYGPSYVGGLAGALYWQGDAVSGHSYYAQLEFPVPMRVSPTVTLTNNAVVGFPSTPGTPSPSVYGVFETRTANATASGSFLTDVSANAELY
jgi:hypothetical protein